jgi:hypothetical protein
VRRGLRDFLSLKSPPGSLNLLIVRRRHPQCACIARSPFWWSGKCASWGRIDLLDLPGGEAQARPFADFGFAVASPMSLSHLLRELPNKGPHQFLMGAGNQALAFFAGKLRPKTVGKL